MCFLYDAFHQPELYMLLTGDFNVSSGNEPSAYDRKCLWQNLFVSYVGTCRFQSLQSTANMKNFMLDFITVNIYCEMVSDLQILLLC